MPALATPRAQVATRRTGQRLRQEPWPRWLLLTAVTIAASVGLDRVGVPSAALFAGLVIAIVLALTNLAPARVPRPAALAAQGTLGVYIGTMVHEDTLPALGSHWLPVLLVGLGTLLLSIIAGATLGLHRDVDALTGALALVAGGASGLVAIARELGGDVRVVAVIQYLRVALITSSMPVVVALMFHPANHGDGGGGAGLAERAVAPWYVSIAILAVCILVGTLLARLVRLPAGALLGPLALMVGLEISGFSFDAAVPTALVQVAYVLIGWQAGVQFTRSSLAAIGRILPMAIALIAFIGAGCAGLGVVLSAVTGISPLEGYLATSPGGIYAVLATAVDTGSNITFIIAAQVIRVLLMLFLAPLAARIFGRLRGRRGTASVLS